MAETAIPIQTASKTNGAQKFEDIVFSATDETNENSFVNSGRERVIIKNASGGSLDIVFESVANVNNRLGDVTVSTDAAKESIVGPFPPHLFNTAAGLVIMDIATQASLTVAVIKDA